MMVPHGLTKCRTSIRARYLLHSLVNDFIIYISVAAENGGKFINRSRGDGKTWPLVVSAAVCYAALPGRYE